MYLESFPKHFGISLKEKVKFSAKSLGEGKGLDSWWDGNTLHSHSEGEEKTCE